MCPQRHIFHGSIFAGYQCHFIFYISIRFHLSFQVHQETAVLIESFPSYCTLFMFGDFEVQVFPHTAIGSQLHWGSQDTTPIRIDTGHRFFEIAGNMFRQT